MLSGCLAECSSASGVPAASGCEAGDGRLALLLGGGRIAGDADDRVGEVAAEERCCAQGKLEGVRAWGARVGASRSDHSGGDEFRMGVTACGLVALSVELRRVTRRKGVART